MEILWSFGIYNYFVYGLKINSGIMETVKYFFNNASCVIDLLNSWNLKITLVSSGKIALSERVVLEYRGNEYIAKGQRKKHRNKEELRDHEKYYESLQKPCGNISEYTKKFLGRL